MLCPCKCGDRALHADQTIVMTVMTWIKYVDVLLSIILNMQNRSSGDLVYKIRVRVMNSSEF